MLYGSLKTTRTWCLIFWNTVTLPIWDQIKHERKIFGILFTIPVRYSLRSTVLISDKRMCMWESSLNSMSYFEAVNMPRIWYWIGLEIEFVFFFNIFSEKKNGFAFRKSWLLISNQTIFSLHFHFISCHLISFLFLCVWMQQIWRKLSTKYIIRTMHISH